MSERWWVQHISKQGEKWEVTEWDQFCWRTEEGTGVHSNCHKYFLPKSEYVLCDPPEQWEDVTAECEVRQADDYPRIMCKVGEGWSDIRQTHIYRLRKVTVPNHGSGVSQYFIVERKVNP